MINVLAVLWVTLSVQGKELLAALFRAAVRLGAALGQPQQDPGWSEPGLTIGAESTGEQVRAALERYEGLASRYDGLRLATLLSRDAAQLAPGWPQVIERARALNAAELVAAIEALQGAVTDWNVNATAGVPEIRDGQTRLWLLARLSRVTQAPEQPQGEGSKGMLVILGLLLLAGLAGGRR